MSKVTCTSADITPGWVTLDELAAIVEELRPPDNGPKINGFIPFGSAIRDPETGIVYMSQATYDSILEAPHE